MAAPSGSTTRGPDAGAAGGGAAGVFCGALHAASSSANASTLFFTFHLHGVARDEGIFFRVLAAGGERHAQELGRLRLHAAAALERLEREDFSDRLQMVL